MPAPGAARSITPRDLSRPVRCVRSRIRRRESTTDLLISRPISLSPDTPSSMGRTIAVGCPEFRRHLSDIDRRSFLKSGILGTLGLSLPQLLRAEAQETRIGRPPRRVTSVVILWMRGGPSHIDTWDPKPDAPGEIRGEFRPIPTKIPGIQICEHLPLSAQIMDKWSIVRSL